VADGTGVAQLERPPHTHRVPVVCLVLYGAVWGALAIRPSYRADWLLENLPVFLAVPIAILAYPRWRFSDRAYIQMTLFLTLHAVGAHYTYSEVPIGSWVSSSLGGSRNHYDRFVHFAFGLLLLRPVRELAFHRMRSPGRWAVLLLSIAGIAALSVVYEVAEWLTAVVVDPRAGTAFLGTQGDPWDAQKDMVLACLGAIAAGLWASPGGDSSRSGGWRVPGRRLAGRLEDALPFLAVGIEPVTSLDREGDRHMDVVIAPERDDHVRASGHSGVDRMLSEGE
jgi:putative membrane protein